MTTVKTVLYSLLFSCLVMSPIRAALQCQPDEDKAKEKLNIHGTKYVRYTSKWESTVNGMCGTGTGWPNPTDHWFYGDFFPLYSPVASNFA